MKDEEGYVMYVQYTLGCIKIMRQRAICSLKCFKIIQKKYIENKIIIITHVFLYNYYLTHPNRQDM